MIQVEALSDENWLVTVKGVGVTTQHRVHVSAEDAKRYGGSAPSVEKLLQASFRFLLERESNTSILDEFDLSVISRYFPEYERAIGGYLEQ